MVLITDLFSALWNQDYQALSEPSLLWIVYLMMFTVVFLENGLLPTSFLPGDSLLLLAGALIANGAMHFSLTLFVLITGAGLGSWFSFWQGRWLGKTRLMQKWLAHVPEQYHRRAEDLFLKHGLAALLIARFLAFIRTVVPILAGLSELDAKRFQLFNWLSAILWITSIVTLGYMMSLTPFFKHHENDLMTLLMILPIALLVIGLAGALLVVWRNKKKHS